MHVLDFLNFGESIKRWINVFYNDVSSSVFQCGILSGVFLLFSTVADKEIRYLHIYFYYVTKFLIDYLKRIKT